MQEFLILLVQRGLIVPVVAITTGGLIAVTAIIASFWHKMRRAEYEASLKHKMLDQGMSAEDIQKVLGAHGPEPWDDSCRWRQSAGGRTPGTAG